MKKILYYTARDMTNPELGINKKIVNQIQILRKHFIVDAVYRRNNNEIILQKNNEREIVLVSGIKRPYKVEESRYLAKYLKKCYYDGCYIRYVYADFQFLQVLRELKRKDTKILVEIPTFPYDKELKDSIENRIVLLLDRTYRNHMKKYVDKIVLFSKEKEVYGIPTLTTMNGVVFSKIPISKHENSLNEIGIIAVADLAPWHGYDRFINGLGQYYQKGGKRNICFYIVGEGTELKRYGEIVKKYNLNNHVIFCGSLYNKELDNIYDKCTLAVECLGMHRKGMNYSSSLKSREYAAKGMPIVTSAIIDVFNKNEYPYIYKVSEDDTPINISKMLQFYDKIYGEKEYNIVAQEIRNFASHYCDMDITMRPVINFFN